MSAVVLATLHVSAVWLATLLVLVGIGRHAQRALGLARPSADRLLTSFWFGYALTIAFLQLWQLVLPVSTWALSVLALAGASGLLRDLVEPRARAELLAASRRPLALAVALATGLWLANVATGPCALGDTGMYHLPMARWLSAHPIVPGLANLQGRFGFNNSSLLFAALFESGPFLGRSHHFAQGPLVLVFLWSVLAGLRAWLGGRSRGAADLFLAMLLAPAAYAAMGRHLTSLSTDLPAALLILTAVGRIVRTTPAERARDEHPEDEVERSTSLRFEATLVAALLATAVTTKLPAAPIALFGTALVFARALRPRPASATRALTRVLPGLAVVLLLGVPWVARSVLLSGYPFYPATLLAAPVDWRVPREQAQAEHAWALDSSQAQGQGALDGPWIGAWLRQRGDGVLAALPVYLAGAWCLAAAVWFRKRTGRGDGALLAACLAASVAWFVIGPNPRFGFGVLWSLAAVSACFAASLRPDLFARHGARLAAASLCVAAGAYTVFFLSGERKLDWRARWLVRAAGPDAGLHPYPHPPMDAYETETGLLLHVPEESNNAWDAPLPATPYPAPNLRLRQADDPAGGFTTDGAWRPERWPKQDSDYLERWRALRAQLESS